MGRLVDGWDKQNKRYTEPWDDEQSTGQSTTITTGDDEEDELGLDSDAMTAPEYEEEDDETLQLQKRRDDDVCEYNEQTNRWLTAIYRSRMR